MKPLDVINSVDFGYRLVWAERKYLVQLAMVPMAIKLLTLGLILVLGWNEQALRSVIISIPSFLATGWMLSHLSRLVFYGQRWPFRPSGDAAKDGIALQERAYGISAGTLFFTLAVYLFMAPHGIILALVPPEAIEQMEKTGQSPIEPSVFSNFAALVILILSLWLIRFIALFIPAAAGLSVRPIVRARQGMLLSLQVLGTGLVSFVPIIILSSFLFAVVSSMFINGNPVSPGTVLLGKVWLVPTVTAAQLIATASLAFGIKVMMEERKA